MGGIKYVADFKTSRRATPVIRDDTDVDLCKELLPAEKGHDSVSSKTCSSMSGSRDGWGHPIEFMLSCVGYAVGIGNLARFPYIVMQNGGGAYLIPYFFFVAVIGIPLFFLECTLGQFSGRNALHVWNLCPLFKGIGYSMIFISGVASILYNMFIAWSLFYFIESFASPLPWADCGHDWNLANCTETKLQVVNGSLLNTTESPAAQYWERYILGISGSINEVSAPRWQLVVALASAWFIVFCCLSKGIRSSGKVAYFTVPLPYVFLTVMTVKGLTLPGSSQGVLYYVNPDFAKLKDYKVWILACVQVFYSLGPAWGGLITMSSYNKFSNRLAIDAIALPLVDCFTSFFGGFAIFALLGHMAYTVGLRVDEVITSGPGLAFVVYPAAIALLPFSYVFAVIFFFMLILLGIDSEFGMMETVTTFVFDSWPKLRQYRATVTGVCCSAGFLLGLPFCTASGMYYFQIFDWYAASLTCVTIAFLESFIVAHVYGMQRFSDDVHLMLGFRLNLVMRLVLGFVVPALMGVMMLIVAYSLKAPTYNGRSYPLWGIGMGWAAAAITFLPIPITAIMKLASKRDGSFIEHARQLLRPTPDWLPRQPELQEQYALKYYSQVPAGDLNSRRRILSSDVDIGAVDEGLFNVGRSL